MKLRLSEKYPTNLCGNPIYFNCNGTEYTGLYDTDLNNSEVETAAAEKMARGDEKKLDLILDGQCQVNTNFVLLSLKETYTGKVIKIITDELRERITEEILKDCTSVA